MNNFWFQRKSITAVALSILTLTTIIDITIVSVGLPHIMGTIGANTSQASWIISGYVISAAICMPLSGMIAKLIGRKRAILICCAIFAVTSILCGQSTSLNEIVLFRILQGIGGAFIPSLTMGYIIGGFNNEERPRVLTLYTMMVVAGPILGPIMGGFITQHMGWGWIFYVNVPICLICFIILMRNMEESKIESLKVDFISFFLLCISIGLIEYFVNAGNLNDWFSSKAVTLSLIFGILFMIFFIWRAVLGKSIIDFRIFKYKNYVISCFILTIYMCIAYSILAYFPLFLENSFKYPVETTGFVVAPRGIAAIIITPFLSKLCKKIDAKILVILGMMCFCLASYIMAGISPQADFIYLLPPIMLQGAAFAFFFMPLMMLAYYKFPKELSNTAGGVFSFFQMIGGSFGIAVGAIILSHMEQVHWNSLVRHISPYNSSFSYWTDRIGQNITENSKIHLAFLEISKLSIFNSYLNLFYFSVVACIMIAVVVLFLNKIKKVTA
ncbi:MAG TPA: DHA2 family efflux MFS transporter permease subunit [Victivallales bacterium]|nr:DHA2 family efflux MFS transporter permease subunit [Victivallales bacterium]